MPDTESLISLTAAVRAHFGLTVRQLARYLGVSSGFVSHLEAGRRGLSPALAPRLLVLTPLLPPPLGRARHPLLRPPPPSIHWRPCPPRRCRAAAPGPATTEHLRRYWRRYWRRYQLQLLSQGQQLALFQRQAAALEHRRAGLVLLRAATPPTDPAEAAHYARWLDELAADLTVADPDPAATAATGRLLAARVAGLRATLALLLAA
ncbi:helix-turn-helix domain-containing protein [Hymenobacter cellulosilyticus]|uniref:Helix-turn-helix domain-containing protein n=1 Tax=Hymenobacter cellulosilyticus TaxID=2932248 RepID=A0A8T9QDR0_9BACT|nr:helix-turn-helix transcriptional regulator [Hymenobacter cellulosilyticus]UOQ73709.1 helix-turn-helix domain-containing protein [Hymenobacter cellulosilyticus]